MKRQTRVWTLTTAALIILALALSYAFIAVAADHDCCGADCAVCALCSVLTKAFHAAVTAVLCAAAVCFGTLLSVRRIAENLPVRTPVRLRVKLSD